MNLPHSIAIVPVVDNTQTDPRTRELVVRAANQPCNCSHCRAYFLGDRSALDATLHDDRDHSFEDAFCRGMDLLGAVLEWTGNALIVLAFVIAIFVACYYGNVFLVDGGAL